MNTDMTDLSFTQTSRAMTSLPLNRARNSYKPWTQIVHEYNKQTLTMSKAERVRVTQCKNPSVFMGVDMLEIIGFIFLCVLNLFFSGICLGWFLVGGFELGNVLTSKNSSEIVLCLSACALNVYFWTLIAASSPF